MSSEKRARYASGDSTGVVVAARREAINRATREVRVGVWRAVAQRQSRERSSRPHGWRMGA